MAGRFTNALEQLQPGTRAALLDRATFLKALQVFQKQPPQMVPYLQTQEQQRIDAWIANTRRGVLLKARQVGGTTAVRAFAFHEVYALGRPARWGTVSYKQASSQEIGRTDLQFLESLPKVLTRALHGVPRSVRDTLEFPRTGGRLIAYTAAASGGTGTRSFALTDGHISELAFYPNPGELLATVEGSVGEGRLIAESTANVPGDYFHRLCLDALNGKNGWNLCTSWWWQNPDYATPLPDPSAFEMTDEEVGLAQTYALTPEQVLWRRNKIARMVVSGQEDTFKREYPGCFADAFYRGGGGEFAPALFDGISEQWEVTPSDPTDQYVIGADPAGGAGGGDDAAYTVRSVSTGQVVAHAASDQWAPSAFARILADAGMTYNKALILVEENNHGHAVLLALRDMGYSNLYFNPATANRNWVSTTRSISLALSYVRDALAAHSIAALPLPLLTQLRAMRAAEGNRSAHAPKGEKDDRAMSFALSEAALRSVPMYVNPVQVMKPRMDAILSRARAARFRNRPVPWAHR